jgi:drug/metabolite transporter (DMT)-like permease
MNEAPDWTIGEHLFLFMVGAVFLIFAGTLMGADWHSRSPVPNRSGEAPLIKHLFSHALLATGFVAYNFRSAEARPTHALLVFTAVTALIFFVFYWNNIQNIIAGKAKWIAWRSSVFYSGYFLCLLWGIKGADASSAALILALNVCTNGAVTIYAKHKKVDPSLLLFTFCILIVILLLQTRGQLDTNKFNLYILFLLISVACDSANTYIRTVWCKINNDIDVGQLGMTGFALSVLPAAGALFIDIVLFTGLRQSLDYVVKYDHWVYLSWVYLGIVPNMVMLTWGVQCEKSNALLYQSLSSTKFIFAGIYMLFIPSILEKSLFYQASPLIISLTILLGLLIYLYNTHDEILQSLQKVPSQ